MKKILLSVLILWGVTALGQNNTLNFSQANPYQALNAPGEKVTYQNPIIPGFHSDPSVCRVGIDYYLITSTFEYFPGVPVFHSKDMVNWEKIGYCLDRKEQIPNGINIFAATIRHHEGTFYMITTNIIGGGNFYVTATNPAGPWSDPVWLKDLSGIDPDLFWDEDGKSYVISSPMILHEIDLKTGMLLGEGKKIWYGAGGRYAEGPHIYKKDGFYYLMAAEGGTEEAHHETIARSNNIWGPYINNPANPILAHANAAGQSIPIQGVGHADIIQAHDNSWWIVFHGYRNISDKTHHILGRETCLAPVSWPKNGWPVVNGNGTATVEMTCPTLPLQAFPEKPSRLDFNTDKLDLDWNYVAFPEKANYSLSDRQGYLRLKGAADVIGGQGMGSRKTSTFMGKRLTDLFFTASTRIEFDPQNENEEAGLILLNNGSHFDILVKKQADKRVLLVKLQFGRTIYTSKEYVLEPGAVDLQVMGERNTFTFSFRQGNNDFTQVEIADAKFLATETVGFFTGVYVGLYATGNGKISEATADYDWFEYKAK